MDQQLDDELGARSIRGGSAKLVAQSIELVLRFGSAMVLSRLLTPEDYGVYAIAAAFFAFFSLFQGATLSTATVQRREINHQQVSTLFWINLALGLALVLLFMAAAPVLAWLYDQPDLVGILLVMSSGFLFAGLAYQHQALLRRQLRLVSLAVIQIVSAFLAIAAAIVLAWRGAGYWALVVLFLVPNIVMAAGVWIVCDWRPGRPRRHTGVRPILALGGQLMGFDLLGYLTRRSDVLLVGWRWGTRQLGFYDKAYQALLLPLQSFRLSISSVAIPALSRLQDDEQRYRDFLDKSILTSVAIGMPMVAFLFVTADRVIPIVFGSQWLESVPIFRALAPASFVNALTASAGWIAISLGRTGRQLWWELAMTVINVTGFLIGLRWGPLGVAIAFSLCQVAVAIPTLVFTCRGTPLKWTSIVQENAWRALAAILAAVALAVVDNWLPDVAVPLLDLLLDAAFFGIIYLALWRVLTKDRHPILRPSRVIKAFL